MTILPPIDNTFREFNQVSGPICSNTTLTPFGIDRCNKVYGGNVCKWANCLPLSKCDRKPKYELHFGKKVDVGKCAGICKSSLDSDL